MTKYYPSLEERRLRIIENCCGGGDGGMDTDPAGDGDIGYSGEADGQGPVAGLDKALGKLKRRKKRKS